MAGRRSLEQLLADQEAAVEGEVEQSSAGAGVIQGTSQDRADRPAEREAKAVPRRPQKPPAKPARPVEGPMWRTLERKEVLFRPEQMTALTELRRELNRERGPGRGERITENTLVRVAVDMLLARSDEVRGITEEELRDSVTPGGRKARRRPR